MSKFNIKSSGFALLDVTVGRKALAKHFENVPASGKCPEELRVPVIIHGYLSDVYGSDDGTSQEFQVFVEKIEVGETK